jgi:hypothetical protein
MVEKGKLEVVGVFEFFATWTASNIGVFVSGRCRRDDNRSTLVGGTLESIYNKQRE